MVRLWSRPHVETPHGQQPNISLHKHVSGTWGIFCWGCFLGDLLFFCFSRRRRQSSFNHRSLSFSRRNRGSHDLKLVCELWICAILCSTWYKCDIKKKAGYVFKPLNAPNQWFSTSFEPRHSFYIKEKSDSTSSAKNTPQWHFHCHCGTCWDAHTAEILGGKLMADLKDFEVHFLNWNVNTF